MKSFHIKLYPMCVQNFNRLKKCCSYCYSKMLNTGTKVQWIAAQQDTGFLFIYTIFIHTIAYIDQKMWYA